MVVGSALSAIAKFDPAAALAKAKQLENEKSDNMRYALMDLYANHGSDANNDYFIKQKNNFTGFESFGFLNLYSTFLKRCNDETVISGAEVFRDFAKAGSNAYVKFFAQKAIKGQINRYQDKEDELTMKLEEAKKGNGDPTATQQLYDKAHSTKTRLQEIYDSTK